MMLFRPKVTPELKQANVVRALRRYGINPDMTCTVEHERGITMDAARNRINSASKTGRISGFVATALNVILPLPGGFTDPNNGTVHVQERTGIVVRLHETVHGHDLIAGKIKKQMKELIDKEAGISILRPVEYVRFKLEEIGLRAVLEGRAKFCEKMAGKDPEFSFFERAKFKLSANTEAGLVVIMASALVDGIIKLPQSRNPVSAVITLAVIGLAAWTTSMLASYVQGMWFMEKINQKLGDPKEVLRVTSEHPPTVGEIFLPNRYLRRISNE